MAQYRNIIQPNAGHSVTYFIFLQEAWFEGRGNISVIEIMGIVAIELMSHPAVYFIPEIFLFFLDGVMQMLLCHGL